MLKTTATKLKNFNPCTEGADKLRERHGETLSILTVLEEMGAYYTLWALCVTDTDSRDIASCLALKFATAALNVAEKNAPGVASITGTARDFIDGRITIMEVYAANARVTSHNARIHALLVPLSGIETNPYRNALAAANAYGEILATMAEYEPMEVEARKVRIIRETLTDKKLLI